MADKPDGKMVAERDLLAVKHAKEKVEQENQELKQRNARLEKRLEIVDLKDVEDGDLKNVKQLFLDREAELDEREAKIKVREDVAKDFESSQKEKEKEESVRTLTEKYAPGGEKEKKAFTEAIKASDDPEKEALRLFAERTKKGEENISPEDILDVTTPGGKVKKSVMDIDTKTPEGRAEFKKYEDELKAKASK